MPINVDTAALSAAANRLQGLRSQAEQQAQAVNAARGALDMEIKARQQFDQRLRALAAQLQAQAARLGDQGRFLAAAAGRYETMEQGLVQGAPRGALPALGEARVGVFTAGTAAFGTFGTVTARAVADAAPRGRRAGLPEQVTLPNGRVVSRSELEELARTGQLERILRESMPKLHTGGLFLAPLQYLDDLIGWADKPTHGLTSAVVDIGSEFIPFAGAALTLAAVTNELEKGHYSDAVWESRGFIPFLGAVEGGVAIGRFISQDLGLADWAANRMIDDHTLDWMPDIPWLDVTDELDWAYDAWPGVMETVAGVKSRFDSGVESILGEVSDGWDWVTS